jgi:hypothetical protein
MCGYSPASVAVSHCVPQRPVVRNIVRVGKIAQAALAARDGTTKALYILLPAERDDELDRRPTD